MKRLTIRRLALTASLLAAAAIAGCRQSPAFASAPVCVSADKLQETDILPHTQGPIRAGRNQVYCAALACLEPFSRHCAQGADPASRFTSDG